MATMNPIRISRLSGFGSKPPQDIDQSPITFGTASSSTIRFDAAFDKGVAPQHARLEWNGEAWWLLDGGSPAGTWIDNRSLAEPTRLDGGLEFQLGASGPRVRVEALAASVATAVPLPAAPPIQPTPASRRSLIVTASILGAVLLLGIAGTLAWPRLFAEKKGLQAPPPAGGDGTALIADAPVGNAVYVPPDVDPVETATYQIGDDNDPEHLITWLPMEPAYQSSAYVQNWSSSGGSGSPFVGDMSNFDSEMALMMEPRYEPEPGGGLPPQPVAAVWTTSDVEMASQMLQQAESGSEKTRINASVPRGKSPKSAVPSASDRQRLAQRTAASVREDGQAAPTEPARPPMVWAVIVGIDDYENINDIIGCKNDAVGMAKILMLHGLLHPTRTYLMTEKMEGAMRPTGSNIKKALNEILTKAAPQDLVIFYFSGHGGEDEASGETIFTGVDFNFDDPLDTGLSGSALQSLIKRSAASKVLMFFDACHAGGLAPLGRAPRVGFRSAPNTQFLDQLAEGRGHVVIRASGKDEQSIGDPKLNHGIFTFVTLSGLTGAADLDKDGIVTLNELRPYVSKETPKLVKQLGYPLFHPSFTSGGQQGESGDIPLTVVPAPKK